MIKRRLEDCDVFLVFLLCLEIFSNFLLSNVIRATIIDLMIMETGNSPLSANVSWDWSVCKFWRAIVREDTLSLHTFFSIKVSQGNVAFLASVLLTLMKSDLFPQES